VLTERHLVTIFPHVNMGESGDRRRVYTGLQHTQLIQET
jgi:hypothetical protein